MAGYLVDDTRKVTTHRLIEMKQQGKKIAMLTSYDYTMARIVDGAGIDVILVGDSASNVMAGNTTTLPITLDQMIYHATSVMHGVSRALVVCDMPFGSYQVNPTEGVTNAVRIMKESGCDALKLEGGVEIIDTVKAILAAGIPVMGHLGLVPQSINKFGTYAVRAKDEAEAEKLVSDAHLLEEAGFPQELYGKDKNNGIVLARRKDRELVDGYSIYARCFDEYNPNWKDNAEWNLDFLRSTQKYLNSKLIRDGYLFLNDVYAELGFDKTDEGQLVGWIYDPDRTDSGDNSVSFGLYDPSKGAVLGDFINGHEKSVFLDFNVDGVILGKF